MLRAEHGWRASGHSLAVFHGGGQGRKLIDKALWANVRFGAGLVRLLVQKYWGRSCWCSLSPLASCVLLHAASEGLIAGLYIKQCYIHLQPIGVACWHRTYLGYYIIILQSASHIRRPRLGPHGLTYRNVHDPSPSCLHGRSYNRPYLWHGRSSRWYR